MKSKEFLFSPGKRRLEKWDTEFYGRCDLDKESAQRKMTVLGEDLDRLQNLLYAGHQHKILIVFQGMDTAGKDGAIRHVFKPLDPQGVRVVSFKVPTQKESDHDFLWRAHKEVPGKGELVIFNRSHYEDVLVTKVHKTVGGKTLKCRYEHINQFERMLSDEGTLILKFYLHISKAEQARRIKTRLNDPDKKWKYSTADLNERRFWNDYMRAYEDALTHCHTPWAPWHIIPADHKWYRNFAVSKVLVDRLRKLNMRYPRSGTA